MTNRAPQFIAAIICILMVSGCQPHRPSYLRETGDLNYYVDQATEISYPDIATPMLEEVTQSRAPITNSEARFDGFWDLGLEDSVQIASAKRQGHSRLWYTWLTGNTGVSWCG